MECFIGIQVTVVANKTGCAKLGNSFIMHWWSMQQRSLTVEAFLCNNESFVPTRCAFRTYFNFAPRVTLLNNRSLLK